MGSLYILSQFTNDKNSLSFSHSKDDAELRGVGGTGRQDLPAAGLEVVGDGAESGESDLVGGGSNRPELENRNVGEPARDLHGAVHPGHFGGALGGGGLFWFGFGFGYGFGLLWLWAAFEPRQQTHVWLVGLKIGIAVCMSVTELATTFLIGFLG